MKVLLLAIAVLAIASVSIVGWYFSPIDPPKVRVPPSAAPECEPPKGMRMFNGFFIRLFIPAELRYETSDGPENWGATVTSASGAKLLMDFWAVRSWKPDGEYSVRRNFLCWEFPISDLESVFSDGTKSRAMGNFLFRAEYKNADKESAALFDAILNSRCCLNPTAPQNVLRLPK